jgi:AcrR family transcriptional regulator
MEARAATVRRTPVQERSNDTVQQIIRATSVLLQRMPLEHITTSRIAAEAGVSIGALYRFFPDKQAIIDAIAVRHVEDFRAQLEQRVAASGLADGPAFMDLVIDAYVAFLDERPDFRTIALGRHVSAATRQREAQPDVGPAGLVRSFMLDCLGFPNSAGLDLNLRIAIEIGEHLIGYAYAQPTAEERAQVIREMKRVLSGYLFQG